MSECQNTNTTSRLFVISPTAWKSVSLLSMSHHYLLFKHMVTMLDVSTWPPVSSAEKFGDQEIIEMTNYFENLFSTGPTQVDKIPIEWVVLKSYMLPIISNNKKSSYLDIWKILFTNATIIKNAETFWIFSYCF